MFNFCSQVKKIYTQERREVKETDLAKTIPATVSVPQKLTR